MAEHERWGSAAATVGDAGSADRAGWVAEQVGGGLGGGVLPAAGMGVALELTTRAASRLAVRRIPVPVVGAIIGGAIGAVSLYGQLFGEGRAELAAKFAAAGEGSTWYERAANNIDAVVAGLDIAGNALDTIGLVAGIVAAIAWALAIPTFGGSLAVATPATAIATGASLASAVLGVIKILGQSLVLLFRSLHSFTSEADPRAVQATGGQLSESAGALGGVLGGFAGSKAGGKAGDRLSLPADPNRAARATDAAGTNTRAPVHPEGPFVEATPRLVLMPDELDAARQLAANPNATVLGADGQVAAGGPLPGTRTTTPGLLDANGNPIGADVTPNLVDAYGAPMSTQPIMHGEPALDLDDSVIPGLLMGHEPQPGVARRIAHTIQDDPLDASSVRPRTRFDPEPNLNELRVAIGGMGGENSLKNLIADADKPTPLASLGYGHGHLVDADGNEIPRQFGPFRGETGEAVIDPLTGKKIWDADATLHLPGTGDYQPDAAYAVRVGQPGSWADHVFDGDDALAAAVAHAQARALAGQEAIADDSALPRGWMPDAPGNQPFANDPINAMNVYEIDPATPRVVSTVAPQPEASGAPGLPAMYPGGGPQAQLPFGTIPKGSTPVASVPVQVPPSVPFVRKMFGAKASELTDETVGSLDAANDAASAAAIAQGGGGGGAGGRHVEPVNPAYERPPGTPEQLAAMRGEIATLLVCQAQADADAAAAQSDQAETARRAEQLVTVAGGVDELDRRTAEQATAVTDTAAANREQQTRQADAGTSLASSASRMTGFATLEVMLGGWAAVTGGVGAVVSLVSESGAAKMNQLNADAVRFMAQLAQAKMLVSGQNAQHPMQMGKLSADATALTGEAGRTTATGAAVQRSQQQVDALGAQNASDAAAAADAEQLARTDATAAVGAATDVQARHDQLAADLAAWAARHREQRRQAVAATRVRLEAQGYEVTDESTW
ncbi:hypothetical protein [Virgisporangium aurantiacum]|uniref:hypothetical protein n=1 Tax=Virgisporangium aurantiacum TaxID=175570 RepID=UPI00194DCD70|nr:hypothetical protein [Virgisporangium aurantiacum]